MKNNVFCDNRYEKEIPIPVNQVVTLALQLFETAMANISNPLFPSSYNYDFDVLLCDDEFIHSVNKEYRNIDSPTDVITFAMFADSEDKIIIDNAINLGQIIISIDKTYSQAKENNIEPSREFLNLLSHGILHLLGVDHPNDDELEKMLTIQNKMIESVNYVKI